MTILWYEPVLKNVYAPISGTDRSYVIDELNRIFSVMTSDRVDSDSIPAKASIDGNVLKFEPCTDAQEGRIVVQIVRMHYGEENEICIDYNFKKLYNVEGTSYREGTTTAFFLPDDEGKYRLNYIMEHNSREINAD